MMIERISARSEFGVELVDRIRLLVMSGDLSRHKEVSRVIAVAEGQNATPSP
jgi:hypothetical protein